MTLTVAEAEAVIAARPRRSPAGTTGRNIAFDANPARRPSGELDVWLARRILAGMTPRAIVAACGGRVSLRAAYRWKGWLAGLEEVTVGGFTATFAIRRRGTPVRLTDWTRGGVSAEPHDTSRCRKWMPVANAPCGRRAGHKIECATAARIEAHNRASAARYARRRQRAAAA